VLELNELPYPELRKSRIVAVTFHLCTTLYVADNRVMYPVRPRRRAAMCKLLASAGVRPSEEELQQTYRSSFEAYMAAWQSGRHYGAREQVLHFLEHFGIDPTGVAPEAIADTVKEIEDASLLADLQLLPGVRETIPRLVESGCRLGLISDTSLTPGRILRQYLAKDGLLEYFTALTFSDETGYPKPDPRMFTATLEQLRAEPEQAAHVGDTPRTDIAGAKALGMVAIRCAGAIDHPEPPPADFVIHDHREVLAILARLG